MTRSFLVVDFSSQLSAFMMLARVAASLMRVLSGVPRRSLTFEAATPRCCLEVNRSYSALASASACLRVLICSSWYLSMPTRTTYGCGGCSSSARATVFAPRMQNPITTPNSMRLVMYAILSSRSENTAKIAFLDHLAGELACCAGEVTRLCGQFHCG